MTYAAYLGPGTSKVNTHLEPDRLAHSRGAAPIDYSRALHLDAEDLAEEGILDVYREIVPLLAEMGISARPVASDPDISDGRYGVSIDGDLYEISPGDPRTTGTARAMPGEGRPMPCSTSSTGNWPARASGFTPSMAGTSSRESS